MPLINNAIYIKCIYYHLRAVERSGHIPCKKAPMDGANSKRTTHGKRDQITNSEQLETITQWFDLRDNSAHFRLRAHRPSSKTDHPSQRICMEGIRGAVLLMGEGHEMVGYGNKMMWWSFFCHTFVFPLRRWISIFCRFLWRYFLNIYDILYDINQMANAFSKKKKNKKTVLSVAR